MADKNPKSENRPPAVSGSTPAREKANSLGLGQTLRAAREAKGATLGQAETATRIRGRYLQALEEEKWADLPESLYVRGFLSSYARYIGLDVPEVLSLYERQQGKPQAEPDVRPATRPLTVPASLWTGLLVGLVVFLAFAAGLIYLYRQYTEATQPPTPVAILDIPTPAPTPTATPLPLLEVTVPDLVGRDLAGAEQDLRALGMKVEVTDRRFNDRWPAGLVITQSLAAGIKARQGNTVGVVLSKGREGVSVPNVVNISFDQAKGILTNAGFKADRKDEPSDKVPAGVVVRQDPPALSAYPPGSTVVVYVSQGGGVVPGKVKVPDVVGKSWDEAKKMLDQAGLQIRSVNQQDLTFVPPGHILSITPPAGTMVDPGSFIDIAVRKQ